MSNGVKFPDILKHENENYAIVDSNDVRGFYITESRWSDFQPISITEGRRKINYIVVAKGSLYQYYGNTVADSDWGQKSNWFQFGIADDGLPISTIHVYPNKEVIEDQCLCEDEPFVACSGTNRIYKFITDGTEFDGEGSDISIQTAQGGSTRYVDIVMLNLSNSFLLKSANLSDVADRQTALKNITASESANIGDILYVDENHNVSFKKIPSVFNIKGRVDTVEDLPPYAEKGDVYLVGLEGSEEFSEYVCIDDTPPCTWESLGPITKEEIWKHGGTGFETSIRPTRQGYIDGADSILLLIPESTALSSNTIVAPDAIENERSSNISIISCNNINIGNYNNYDALIASENIKLDGFSYSAFIANKTQITSTATQGSGSSGLLNYGDITYSLISANYSTDDLQHMRIKGKSLVIIGNEMSNSAVTYIGSYSESKSTLISSNVFNDQIRYDGSYTSFFNNIFEGNSYISAFRSILAANRLGASGMGFYFNDSAIFASDIHSVGMYGSKSFITTSNISDGSTEDLSQSAIISSDISAFDLRGEKVGLLLTNASGFVMNGNNSLILTSYITAGSYKQSYSTFSSVNITNGGFGNNQNGSQAEFHKYFTFSSVNFNSAFTICEDTDNEESSEYVSISTTYAHSNLYIGKYIDDSYNFLKFSSIDSSETIAPYIAGEFVKISSSFLDGGVNIISNYTSVLSSRINSGSDINGVYNTVLSSNTTGGTQILGNYNLVSTSNCNPQITGSYNTILSSNGGNPNDKLGNYTAIIASELTTVDANVTHSAAIAMHHGRMTMNESYTLYTDKLKSINIEVLDEIKFGNGSSKITSTINPLTISSIGYIDLISTDVKVNGISILKKMNFSGEVQTYEDLPDNANVGDVYSIQEAVDVYDGFTPETIIGVYPPSTNFVKTENGYESLGGYISYITNERIDEICV